MTSRDATPQEPAVLLLPTWARPHIRCERLDRSVTIWATNWRKRIADDGEESLTYRGPEWHQAVGRLALHLNERWAVRFVGAGHDLDAAGSTVRIAGGDEELDPRHAHSACILLEDVDDDDLDELTTAIRTARIGNAWLAGRHSRIIFDPT